jgi:hypothetical protein
MTNCKFLGFRHAVHVESKAHVTMIDCLVELSTKNRHEVVVAMVSGFDYG